MSEELAGAFCAHYDAYFADHNTQRPGYHENFYEYMTTREPQLCGRGDFESTPYLKGKYGLS